MREYIVIGRPRGSEVWEPMHPGHMDSPNTANLVNALRKLGIGHRVVTTQEWEDINDEQTADLFCKHGLFWEDCSECEHDEG